MTDYSFVTTWCLDAPIDRVFAAIDDAARWPQWWRGVSQAELLEPGGPVFAQQSEGQVQLQLAGLHA